MTSWLQSATSPLEAIKTYSLDCKVHTAHLKQIVTYLHIQHTRSKRNIHSTFSSVFGPHQLWKQLLSWKMLTSLRKAEDNCGLWWLFSASFLSDQIHTHFLIKWIFTTFLEPL